MSTGGLASAGGGCGETLFPYAIFTEIPGHPTAAAPGLGLDFTGFLSLNTSPDGSRWIFKAFVDDLENDVMVAGGPSSPLIVARENDPTAVPGTVHSFTDSDCGISDSGVYAYGSRLEGVDSSVDEIIFSGTLSDPPGSQIVAAREGDPAPGLIDPFGAGDEVFGNSLNSVHVLADGTVAFRADLIQNIDRDYESALYHGDTVVAQEGTAAPDTGLGPVYDSFVALSGNTFSSSADGSSWIVEADIEPGLGSTEAAIVDGVVVAADGGMLPGSALAIDGIFAVDMDEDGDWLVRGDFTDDTDWAVRNGLVIAITGMPITPGSTETWGDALVAVHGQGANYLVVGNTSEDRQVVVLNGERVLASSGDAVPLSGGVQAEIDRFSPEDISLVGGPTSMLAFVVLRDAVSGVPLGDAFLGWDAVVGCNPSDIAEPCGVLDLADISAFITGFTTQSGVADFAEPFGVWDLADIASFIQSFTGGCP